MKIIIVGASDHQKEILEPLKNVIDVEVIFVDSFVRIETDKFTLINTPTGLMPDFMVSDDVIGDHKLNKDLIDFNEGKRLSDSMLINDLRFIKAKENLNRSAANKSKPKQISYGPKKSCGKGKIKRW